MAQPINVKLSRFDSSPWGFRLQGGKDFGAPLLIQKVNGGSLAEKAGLQAGDAVIKVNDVEVFNMRHKEAQDAIVRAGNNFAVTVQRGGSTWKPNVTPVGPTPTINSSPAANIQPVTKTSLAANTPAAKPIGSGHNLSAKPFGGPQVNGEPMVKSIVNKQYNTPVGMYSEESIAETLSAQAEVLAGGVLGVNFMKNEKNYNAANSEVFKMVQEIDNEPRETEPAPPASSTFYSTASHAVGGTPRPITPQRLQTGSAPAPAPAPSDSPKCSDCERYIVGGKAPAGTISAALSSVTGPAAPRPVPGPTSAPAPAPAVPAPAPRPAPAPVSPSSPQTIGPMPFHSPGGTSAPKPFSVPTAPTTSPARPAPATSNKLVWPPHQEEGIPSSLLATATPLYIPPAPKQPKNTAIFAVPTQPNQTQPVPSQKRQPVFQEIQEQITSHEYKYEELPISLPRVVEDQPSFLHFQPHSDSISQVNEIPLENSQTEAAIEATTISGQESSIPQVQEQIVESVRIETESAEKNIQSQEINYSSVISEEVSSITQCDNIQIEDPIAQPTLDNQEKERPPSPPPPGEQEQLITQESCELETTQTCEEMEVVGDSVVTQEIKSESVVQESIPEAEPAILPESNATDIVPLQTNELNVEDVPSSKDIPELNDPNATSVSQVPSEQSETAVAPPTEAPEPAESTATDASLSQAIAEPSEPIASNVSLSEPSALLTESVSSGVSQLPQTELQTLQSSCTEVNSNIQPEPQLSMVGTLPNDIGSVNQQNPKPEPQLVNPAGGNSNPQPVSTFGNKGLSYRQIPQGGFRPISSEYQEISQYTSQESFHQTTTNIQSSANPGPVPEQNPVYSPKIDAAASDNQTRENACSSPMVSALTIAPDRPYCLVPSAMKPSAPPQVQSFVPLSQSVESSKIIIQDTKPTLPTSMPSLGDETQLPEIPPSSRPMSMLEALTIAPDRPYSPLLTAAYAPNTVVQSEASAFTAVSPQTVNTKPKMTVPPQPTPTAVSNVGSGGQGYMLKPLPTSTVKRMASKPASPRPASRSTLPVMGGFRPTVPTSDLRPSTPDNRGQFDLQQLEFDSLENDTRQVIGTPNLTQMSTSANSGGQVIVQRTKRVEESSSVSHREMQKTIQRSGFAPSVISSQESASLSSMQSTITGREIIVGPQQKLKQPIYNQQQQFQQIQEQQQQQTHYSSFGAQKPSTIPYYQQDIERFQIQRALSPAPHSPHVRALSPVPSPVPTQKPVLPASPSIQKEQPSQPSPQPKPPASPMVSQYRKQQLQQQQQDQKQLFSLSNVQKPAVIPFYQKDIERYQRQRAISPAPHLQQVQRAISPALVPSVPAQLPVSQIPIKSSTPTLSQQPTQQKPTPVPTVQNLPQQIAPAPPQEVPMPPQQMPPVPSPAVPTPSQQVSAPSQAVQTPPQQIAPAPSPAVPTPSQQVSAPSQADQTPPQQIAPAPSSEIKTPPQQKAPVPSPAIQSPPQQTAPAPSPALQTSQQKASVPSPTVQSPPQQRAPAPTPAVQTKPSEFSLPFPNIPLPEGMSVDTLMKNVQFSQKTTLTSQSQVSQSHFQQITPQAKASQVPLQPQPQPSQVPLQPQPQPSQVPLQPQPQPSQMPPQPQPSQMPSVAQPSSIASQPHPSPMAPQTQLSKFLSSVPQGIPRPSPVTPSSPSAFKPQPQQPAPTLATQPSSVTKIPVPPSSSSIPNAGGGIGGGAGGGPSGQKGSASFAGSTAPIRGRGVLTQQTPGARIPLCGFCNNQIRGPFITALGKIWCPEHFVCVNAQCRRQLQDIGFVEEKGDLYCEFCFEQYIAPSCSKCSKKIKGDCLNAIGKQFHPECFLCAYCGKLFGNNPFYLEDGLPYCEADWNELFTTKCFACGFPIEAGDRWVEALNNNYHSQCFNCTSCKKNLEGQNFYAKGGRPFCKAHAR